MDHEDYGFIVELDGRLGHEWARDRWADLDRDVVTAVRGELTMRAGWMQVLEPCRLASAVASILSARGWVGRPVRCGVDCLLDLRGLELGEQGGSHAPGA